MRELLLLRHGRTEQNERRQFTGATDVPLSEGGRDALLARKGTYPPATMYFTSGMRRTNETLALLYGDVPYVAVAALGEYRFGDFEGRTHADLYDSEPVYRAWLEADGKDVVCPGGESMQQFEARLARGWHEVLAHPWQGLAVLVVHGGVISGLLRLFGGTQLDRVPDNGAGYRVTLAADGQITDVEAFA